MVDARRAGTVTKASMARSLHKGKFPRLSAILVTWIHTRALRIGILGLTVARDNFQSL